ncbi:sarcosine oxidase subunit gamma [Brevibacterium sandarakinum]|uniref:sarcosine oxidase subunit gamma n=1 Tax=Brevibacterium sandarakinum TaxID=629680 RepID=UPI00264A61F8|nr:sarcosine oxidase subunit gamma family protein [Brevibacterium sandarakinum]MDN5656617.1 sarcosine oxidase subunit gamma [Brevibacterium sandarakinum]
MAETTHTTEQRQTQLRNVESSAEALDALRVSPGAHLAEEMATATKAGGDAVGLRERAFAVQLGLRATPGTASAQALESALGITLPKQIGEVTGDEAGLYALWLGPDEFLVVDVARRQRPGETLIAEASLEGLPGQAVDLSANRTILELTGSKAREVLEKSVRTDLHPRVFGVGTAISTQLGPVPVIVHHSAKFEYRIYPRASFADFTVRWLLDGMAEFLTAGGGAGVGSGAAGVDGSAAAEGTG